ncbi:MAG: hypothetical protein RL701_5309, partial [Pseudomonadota bacterium]
MPRVLYGFVLLGTLCFLLIGRHLAASQSAAFDEVTDVGSGYALLHGNWRMDPEHLPLTKLIAALSLARKLPEIPLPSSNTNHSRWHFGNKVLYGTNAPPLELLQAARAPLIWLNALLIPLIGWFTFRVAGLIAAAVAVVLASTEPLWLAHATLVGSDAMPSVLIFATTCLAYLLVHGETKRRNALRVALCASVALCIASKYYTPAALVFVWIAAARDAQRAGTLSKLLPELLGVGLVGAVLGVCFAWGWPPNPARYLYGLQQVGKTYVPGYTFYAFGDFFGAVHRLYFLEALAVKV